MDTHKQSCFILDEKTLLPLIVNYLFSILNAFELLWSAENK